MGKDASLIPHLLIGARNGCGIIDLDRIQVSPGNWQSYAADFAAAPKNLTFEFPDIEVLDCNSCSACQSTLLLFLQKYGESLAPYIPAGERLKVAIGKGHDSLPAGTLCIGQCTACHKESGVFVPGCPPVGSQIYKTLQNSQEKP
jgi:hypothetical protein